MQTWLVIYRLNSGKLCGWVGRAESASDAEEEFQMAVTTPYTFIQCVALLASAVIDALFAAYKEQS